MSVIILYINIIFFKFFQFLQFYCRTLATYLVWRILVYRLNSLPFKYREIHNRYKKVRTGETRVGEDRGDQGG